MAEKKQKEKLTANILFSGIGCQEKGIDNSRVFQLEVLSTSDIDKESIVSYAGIHCGLTKKMIDEYDNYPSKEDMAQYLTELNIGYNPSKKKYYDWFKLAKSKSNKINKYWLACKLSKQKGDILRIEELPFADLWTISFCCQDISIAGKMKGLKLDSKTQSSLLWKSIALLQKSIQKSESPKSIMFENVKNLVSEKFKGDFNQLIEILEELGYNTYWQILNSKDCGIPQNRERVFVVCIRKDIDKKKFTFPKPFDIGIRLMDILDENVEDKYIISINGTRKAEITRVDMCLPKDNQLLYVTSSHFNRGENKCIFMGELRGGKWNNIYESSRRYYSIQGVSPTLCTCKGGNTEVKIIDNQGYIRKLTPLEYWLLTGLSKDDFTKAKNLGIANCNLYAQAGNGIVTNCVSLVAEHLYKAQYNEHYSCTDEIIIACSEIEKAHDINKIIDTYAVKN